MAVAHTGAVGAHNAKVMNRYELTKRAVAHLKHDEAVIGGIGNSNFDLWASGQRPQNYYMLGSMGLAIPIALGVAIAQPKRHVIALEGDGSLLMQLGCLSTVGMFQPKNLTMVVWDNGIYQITGAQPTASSTSTDLVGIARVLPALPTAPGLTTRMISTGCLRRRLRAGRR
jgi:thiamine pyrophosphate-dependent acetolactate synthase large subunit-like protein